MRKLKDCLGCELTIESARIFQELLLYEISRIKNELNTATGEKKEELSKRLSNISLLNVAIIGIVKNGVGLIKFFSNRILEEDGNGEIFAIAVGY
jgi:hypothetical protein